MEINKTTIIKLDLTVQKLKNDKFVVGNIKKDVFLEVPTEFLYILEFSDGKKSIEQIEQKIFQNYNILLDVTEIMNTLHEVGLIFSIDGKLIGEDNNVLYSPILKKIAYLFFSHFSIYFYIGVFIFNFVFIITHPTIYPSSANAVLFEDKPGLSLLIYFCLSWLITICHEFGHFLAAVKLQIPVHLKLNLRLIFLVVESNINGIWGVSRNKRYICYLAGFFIENLIVFILLIANFCIEKNVLLYNISKVVILICFLNFLWQFMIFLRTDFYLVLLNFLGVSSLHDNAIELIKEFFFQKKISRTDNKIKIYLVIYIFGLIFSTIYYVYNIFIYVNIIILAKTQFFNHTASTIDMFFLAVLLIISIFIWLIGFINKINEIGRK